MKGGPKPNLPSVKAARGTFRPHRDGRTQEVIENDALPSAPDWLTTDGQMVWMDEIGRVTAGRLVSERDSTMFANYCNLQGALVKAWRDLGKGVADATVPPAAHLMEARKMAEQFGIFGAKSRLKVAPDAGSTGNQFARNGRRG